MSHPRTAYELGESQVATPEPVVSLFWQLIKRHRKHLGSVLDMGAGDCRLGRNGFFEDYVGVEIDKKRIAAAQPPVNGRIVHDCVFRHGGGDYDACVANPPYARHHDLEGRWKDRTVERLEREMAVSLDKHCNLCIYFFCLALLKTCQAGLVALIVPYEWVSRPSAEGLREYIRKNRWGVAVYRFRMPIFEGVLTTASVSIVDKARRDGRWKYYDITSAHKVVPRNGMTNSKDGVLEYSGRGSVWALRGLSPGTQKIFTLTEGERIRAGLGKRDVVPCITTLRGVPRELHMLSKAAFREWFVKRGAKCWLIRSSERSRSRALNAYLEAVPENDRKTYTCENQTPWFNYHPHPVPQVLLSFGFTRFGPKVLINSAGAQAVGSVLGIHGKGRLPLRRLQRYLLGINFERAVVPHAKTLKKVEVKQVNTVLNAFVEREHKNGGGSR